MDRPDGRMPMYAISLDSPEEIAKWIEERKKMWPSEANIARKQKEEQERIARGEVLPNNNSRKRNRDEFDHGGRGGRGGRGRFTRGGGRGGYGGWRTSLEGKCDGGPLDLAAAASAVDQTGPEPNANPLSLISGYGSDREEDREDDQEPETTSSKDPASIGKIALREEGECDENGRKIRRIDRPCKYFMKGRCNKGDKCMFRHDTA
ncbi:nuclear fragile X mental retardation-interacting protein 1-domain-containing protein, partial [Jimgerdemannia flammicorona]